MIVAARTVSRATIDGAWIETPQTSSVKASKRVVQNGAHGGALRPASSLYAWTQEGCLLSPERMVVAQPISPFNQIGEITPQFVA